MVLTLTLELLCYPEMKSYKSDIDESPCSIFNESPSSILDLSPPTMVAGDGGGLPPQRAPPAPPPPSSAPSNSTHHHHLHPVSTSEPSPLDLESLAMTSAACPLFPDLDPRQSPLHLTSTTPTAEILGHQPCSSVDASCSTPDTTTSATPATSASQQPLTSRGCTVQGQLPQPLAMVHSNSQLQNLLQSFPQNVCNSPCMCF